ncbi:MAG: PaaI family thioesterase [Oscillospiraceae bacterium]|nr:PaaI family thioesterase [Oscillospiraceae bacterium]
MTLDDCIERLHQLAPGSIGDLMNFWVVSEDRERGEYTLRCKTFDWMRNTGGSLHGGMGAAILDQAMGYVAYSYIPGPGKNLTVQMQQSFYRPLIPGEDVIVRVRVISAGRTLISMTAEASRASDPNQICISGSGTSYFKLEK